MSDNIHPQPVAALPTDSICSKVSKTTTSVFFKHQQRGEPDLVISDKYDICNRLLQEKPVEFLHRYKSVLSRAEMEFLNTHYCQHSGFQEIVKQLILEAPSEKTVRMRVKNRRYEALKELIKNGEYFSDVEMRHRCPLQYEQMIGQYQSQSDRNVAFHDSSATTSSGTPFSDALLSMIDIGECNRKRQCEEMIERFQNSKLKRTADDDDDDESEMSDSEPDDEIDLNKPKTQISDGEKDRLRLEFIALMHERFLGGLDGDFNYSNVDDNEDYDSIDLFSRDAEDKYFDSEPASFC